MQPYRYHLDRLMQGFGGGGYGSGSPPVSMQFPTESYMILPANLSMLCAAGAIIGAAGRVLMENKRQLRAKQSNWITFGICTIFGVPIALASTEALFRTQPWARESSWALIALCVLISSAGQGLAMQASEGANSAGKLVIDRLTQALGALFGAKDKK